MPRTISETVKKGGKKGRDFGERCRKIKRKREDRDRISVEKHRTSKRKLGLARDQSPGVFP